MLVGVEQYVPQIIYSFSTDSLFHVHIIRDSTHIMYSLFVHVYVCVCVHVYGACVCVHVYGACVCVYVFVRTRAYMCMCVQAEHLIS